MQESSLVLVIFSEWEKHTFLNEEILSDVDFTINSYL